MRKILLVIFAASSLLMSVSAETGTIRQAQDKPNIILYFADDISAREFPIYGTPQWSKPERGDTSEPAYRAKTPVMDKLAEEGCWITSAWAATLYHEDMRAVSPRLWPYDRMYEYKDVLKEKTLPRSPTGNPTTDLWEAIRGNVDTCSSDFNYASKLTETVLLGAMALRANETLTWDAENMKCSSKVAQAWVDEPVRKGWEYSI